MRIRLLVVLAVALSAFLAGPAAPAGAQPPTETEQQFFLSFKDAIHVYVFTGTTTPGTTLTVDTRDFGIPGDSWGVRIFAAGGGDDDDDDDGDDDGGIVGGGGDDNGDDDDNGGGLSLVDEACGTGSLTEFSGAASAQVSGAFVVEVFYCEGVDVFPAHVFVRFRYENGLGFAAPTGTCQEPDKSCEPPGGYQAPGAGDGDDDEDDD